MNEQVEFVDDVCTHPDCDCNCKTAREKMFYSGIQSLQKENEDLRNMVAELFCEHKIPWGFCSQGKCMKESKLNRKSGYIKAIHDRNLFLESSLRTAEEALENIQTITFKGKESFSKLASACRKVNDPDLILWAKDSDALSSLVYKFADDALAKIRGKG